MFLNTRYKLLFISTNILIHKGFELLFTAFLCVYRIQTTVKLFENSFRMQYFRESKFRTKYVHGTFPLLVRSPRGTTRYSTDRSCRQSGCPGHDGRLFTCSAGDSQAVIHGGRDAYNNHSSEPKMLHMITIFNNLTPYREYFKNYSRGKLLLKQITVVHNESNAKCS